MKNLQTNKTHILIPLRELSKEILLRFLLLESVPSIFAQRYVTSQPESFYILLHEKMLNEILRKMKTWNVLDKSF